MMRLVSIFAAAMLASLTLLMWLRREAPPAGPALSEQSVKEYLPDGPLPGLDRLRYTPYGDQRLYFEIDAPKGWELRPSQLSGEQYRQYRMMDTQFPVPLMAMGPKGRDDVGLEVRYMRVPPRVTLGQFMRTYAEQAGYTVVARQHGQFGEREVQDELVRIGTSKFGAVLMRMTASRKGDLIFMVGASAREADYPNWKRIFGAAARTFDPDAAPPAK